MREEGALEVREEVEEERAQPCADDDIDGDEEVDAEGSKAGAGDLRGVDVTTAASNTIGCGAEGIKRKSSARIPRQNAGSTYLRRAMLLCLLGFLGPHLLID